MQSEAGSTAAACMSVLPSLHLHISDPPDQLDDPAIARQRTVLQHSGLLLLLLGCICMLQAYAAYCWHGHGDLESLGRMLQVDA